MASKAQITHVFRNVQQRLMNSAQRRLTDQLQSVMFAAYDYATEQQRNANFSDMTGNWINSFGVALYRDGRCVAVANMSENVDEPIRTTLIDYDVFEAGERRFDSSIQQKSFEIDGERYKGAADQVYYDEEVLKWLGRTWTKQKGFSYRVISVAEYHKPEARTVLLMLSDEMESKGGNIWQFHLD